MSDTQRRKALHWAWIILAVCFIDLFINYGIRLGYSVLLPEMIRTLGLTRRQGGDIFNSYFVVYVILSLFTGYLTDRLGARKIISCFCIILGIGTFLMGTVQNFWQACIVYGIVGMGGAAMWTPIITLVQRWFFVKKRGMALGILSTGFGLGFATMGRFYPAVVAHWNWRYCWYILGIAAFLMVAGNAILLRSRPEDKGLKPWYTPESEICPDQNAFFSSEQHKISYSRILTASNFWLIGFSYFLISAPLYLLLTFMVDYARYELGFTYGNASLLATFHGFGQIAGVLTIPFASDYMGRRLTILISNICVAISIACIVLSGSNEILLFISVGFLGTFFGATFPLYGACGGDYFHKKIMGTVIGGLTLFYGCGAIFANRLGGHIRDITGSFTLPFTAAIVLAICSALLIFFVKYPKKE